MDIEKFAADLVSLNVTELQQLKKVLKDKYGLEETIAVSVAPVAEIAKVEEQTEFKVLLTKVSEVSAEKLNAVKVANHILNIGLKATMDLFKALPVILKESATKVEAEAIRAEFAVLNAIVELK